MLVLTRNRNESIIITTPQGEIIKILIADVKGQKVRVGIEAPQDVTIDREEIYEAKRREGTVV